MKLRIGGHFALALVGAFAVSPRSASAFVQPSLQGSAASAVHNSVPDARSKASTTIAFSSASATNEDIDWSAEIKEVADCASSTIGAFFASSATAEDIVKLCDDYDAAVQEPGNLLVNRKLQLRSRALEMQRYEQMAKLLQSDYDAYVATASFLSPSRIPRLKLPNVQDVPMHLPGTMQQPEEDGNAVPAPTLSKTESKQILEDGSGAPLVPDCEFDNIQYSESPLDKALLFVFRKLVTDNTNGVSSPKPGIEGLLEQGRTYMLQPGRTAEDQHKMVRETLAGLMTPVLPPFYRIFMSGIVPNVGSKWDGKQIGPWFYAPFLTSFVTPTFFGFLVGPSYVNRRKDGQLGGLVVEKCKFLQESGCKGLCLHQCKLPAQQFFKDELGLSLTVSPNFVTQECQWSFGEEPLPPSEDPSFPKGCLVGCESRKAIAASGSKADICN